MSTLDELAAEHEHLADYGWRRRPSGRYVHPDLPLANGRRRVFTVGEAMTLTQTMMRDDVDECADCGSDECPGAVPTVPMPEVPTP